MRLRYLLLTSKRLLIFLLSQHVIRNKINAILQFLLGKNNITLLLNDSNIIIVSRDLFRELINNINKIVMLKYNNGNLWVNCGELPLSVLDAVPELLSGFNMFMREWMEL